MNLILLEEHEFLSPAKVRLSGEKARHILTVHRSQIGEALCVGQLNGRVGKGVVTQLSEGAVELKVELSALPPPPLPTVALIALPRPKALRRILQFTTTLGVKQIYFFHAFRVEKSFWGSEWLRPDKMRQQLCLGLEQAQDTFLPEVYLRRRFKPFFEDEAPELLKNRQGILAHPKAQNKCPNLAEKASLIAIGPEGGFINYELELLKELGFLDVNLGPRVLKTETAVTVLLTLLHAK